GVSGWVADLRGQAAVEPALPGPPVLCGHLVQLVTQGLPDMLGVRPHAIRSYGMISSLDAGSKVAAAALGAAVVVCGWRVLRTRRPPSGGRGDSPGGTGDDSRFTLYLALVGLQSVLAYGLKTGMSTEVGIVINYVLLALF